EGLYVRRRSGQRDIEHGTDSTWSKSQERSSRLRCYIWPSEEHLKRDCPRIKVLSGIKIRYPVLELMGEITWLILKKYDGGNILLGNGRKCRIRGTSKVQVHIRDGLSFVLDNVMYVPELRRNLISLGTLKKEGFTVQMQSGKIKVIKGSLMVLSGTRMSNCVYTLDGQAVTSKTFKDRKQLGEYQTGWKIKMGNVLDSYKWVG
ncbi:hypothetical protein Tco_0165204, partial [Tanacetum coccineum]